MSGKLFAIKPIPTTYAGVKYRGRSEARWGLFFDALRIPFQYEFDGFALRTGAYLPDFWLPDQRVFLEVKGTEPTLEEEEKCAELTRATEANVLIAVGAPEERFQITWFDRDGKREDTYVWAADQIVECGFWLVCEDPDDLGGTGHSSWIGPRRTALYPRGPMFSGALEQAYAAARSARFDATDGLRERRAPVFPWADDRHAHWWKDEAA